MANNLVVTCEKVIIDGTSKKSLNDAISDAFHKLQYEAYKKTEYPIVYMKAVSAEVLENTTKEYTEKFLLFFFPRKRATYFVKIEVEIEMTVLKV